MSDRIACTARVESQGWLPCKLQAMVNRATLPMCRQHAKTFDRWMAKYGVDKARMLVRELWVTGPLTESQRERNDRMWSDRIAEMLKISYEDVVRDQHDT